MSVPKVLYVLTSHASGWYLPEFAHPYDVLSPYTETTVASPKGGEAPIVEASVETYKDDSSCANFYANKKVLWQKTEKLESFLGKAGEFRAIFVVGGHGPMFDLATDPATIQLIREFYESGAVVAAVCHGSAALVNVKLSNGANLVAGHAVTGFSNSEEEAFGTAGEMPFSLETELKTKRGKYSKAKELWGAHVVAGEDKKLITGQNPASALPLAEELLKVLKV